MRWDQAHKIAMLKARHAHKDFDIDTSSRIDVFNVIESAGLLLGFEPMPRLSGAYFAPDRAILINSNHPLARQRYTAGHEFGHFVFKHETSVDPQTDPLSRWGGRTNWPPHEKQAEAFAAWFLMPLPLVRTSLKQLRIDRPESPEDVYALALRLGTSYEATARHLANLKLASDQQVRTWVKTTLAQVKVALAEGAPPESLRNDVWHLERRDDEARIAVRVGDRLVVELEDIASSGYVWQLDGPDDIHLVLDSFRDRIALLNERGGGEEDTDGSGSRHIFVLEIDPDAEPREEEIRFCRTRPWSGEVADTYRLDVEIMAPRHGISEKQMRIAA